MSMTIGGILLDKDMNWDDEFAWSQTQQKAEYSITGDVVIQSWKKRTYRPLTLVGDANHGWQSRTTVQALRALASATNPNLGPVVYTVEINTVSYVAVFDSTNGDPVEFKPVTWEPDPDGEFWYTGTIRMRILM